MTPEAWRVIGLSFIGTGGMLIGMAGAVKNPFLSAVGSLMLMLGVWWVR